MREIPSDYAAIETSEAYRTAQEIGASVSRRIGEEEYDHILDPTEYRLLRKAGSSNVTFYLESVFERYSLCVGLEGYVRPPESLLRLFRRMFLGLLPAGPPPGIKGIAGRPQERKTRLHLPSDRQQEVFARLQRQEFSAVIQAAFARKLRSLMRVYRNSDMRIDVVADLQSQYEEALAKLNDQEIM